MGPDVRTLSPAAAAAVAGDRAEPGPGRAAADDGPDERRTDDQFVSQCHGSFPASVEIVSNSALYNADTRLFYHLVYNSDN